MKKFYYLNNTCDHDLEVGGEILVVFDDKKNPIWHHDWSDSVFDFPDLLPRSFMKKFDATYESEFIELSDTKSVKRKIEEYLYSNGYSEE